MKRIDYQKPTMKVVLLKQKSHILAGSNVRAMRSGYGAAEEQTWGEGE